METESPEVEPSVKLMASIGHICIQWSRLEMTILGVIYVVKDISHQEGELIFGGLDILPRINMAIALAEHHKVPVRFQKRLRNVRDKLQGRKGIAQRRNQAVHGAYEDLGGPEFPVTMVRWREPKRRQMLTVEDLRDLGLEIHDLGTECWSIVGDIAYWKFGYHLPEDEGGQLTEVHPSLWVKITKHINASINHLWRKLK